MRLCFTSVCPVLSIALLGCPGCGGGGGASGTTAESSKPLDGKDLGDAKQLLGRWVAVTEGQFIGLEFLKDGKVLLDDGRGGVASFSFSVLEGGRLSLGAGDLAALTEIYDTTIAGDQMELSGTVVVMIHGDTRPQQVSQRFRRLKKDEKLAEVLVAQQAERARAYQDRVAALGTFLKQPGLVMTFGDAPGAPASIALDIKADGNAFIGRAWHDDRPPHLNAISGQPSGDPATQALQLSVMFGNRIAPATTQPDGGGQITMNVEGEGKDLRITSRVRYGDGPEHEMVLRSDPGLHGSIVSRFDAELARIEAIKQPVIALLKDHAVLRGQLASQDQRRAEPDIAELTLARDPSSGQYWCEGVHIGARGRGELVAQAAAEIAVVNDQPVLRIVCPPSREYQLRLAGAGAPGLTGTWMPIGSNQGWGAQFEVVESLDAAARDALFEAQRRAFKTLSADSSFSGLAHEDSASGMDMPIPCRVQFTVSSDGSVTGKVEYPSVSTLMTVSGQVAETRIGPRLQLSFTSAEHTPGDQIFFRSLQNGMWSLAPVGGEGPMKLSGWFRGPTLRTTTLTLVNDESLAHLRERAVKAIGTGGRFLVARFVGWQGTIGWPPNVVPTVVQWSIDDSTGTISGGIVADGRALGTNEQAVTDHEGRLRDDDGWITMEIMQSMPWGRNKGVAALKLYACEDDAGGLHLSGAMQGFPVMPMDAALPAFPEQLDRLVEFVPVSETDAQTRAAVDKAIAAVEKAKADALAAQKAQEQAALDARRDKLAPFFPLFKAQTGLVITTNSPMELGLVVVESLVDEPNATITGKGIDLHEMPFREFTFECGVNNWGHLTLTTSLGDTAYAFAAPTDGRVAAGRYMALTLLSSEEHARLAGLIAMGRRLQGAPQSVLTVEVLDPAEAKARETTMVAYGLPGVAIYRGASNPQVAAMFTPQSNGRYRWAKEPILHRLNEPLSGKALYIKNGGPTDNLTVVINGVHRANIAAIAQLGAAIVHLPPDLEILDLRLEAVGTVQARGVVLLR